MKKRIFSIAAALLLVLSLSFPAYAEAANSAPESPSVTAGANVRCFPNDAAQVSVTAFVGSGSLSYQWYSNTENSLAGGTPISGANQPVCKVDTSRVGTMYYYCAVTNTVGGQSRGVTSGVISVTVEELSVSSITVETLPSRTAYTVGDVLDASGLSIRVNHANGSSRVISDANAFGLYPTRLNNAGMQNIEVSYQGLTCTFQVSVQQAEEAIEGIGVLTLPSKRHYTVGETLDTAGLSIRVYTNNGQRDVTEGFICSPMAFDRAGNQTVTVSYGGKTCTFTLEIEEEEKPTNLVLDTLPTKLNYTVGDTLDTSGLVLREITNRNNAQTVTSGFTCSPTVLNTAGRQQITVTYGNLSCVFNVTVAEAAQTSPPVQTPAVQMPAAQPTGAIVASPQPTAAPTPHIIEHQSHNTGASSVFIVIIVIAAVLGLGSLGAYVYIMNRGGIDGVTAEIEEFITKFKEKFKKK